MSLPEQHIHINTTKYCLPWLKNTIDFEEVIKLWLWRLLFAVLIYSSSSFLSHICLLMSRLEARRWGKAFQNVSKVEFRWRCFDTLSWLDPTMSGIMETLKLCLAWCKMTLLTVTTRPWPSQLEWKIAQKIDSKKIRVAPELKNQLRFSRILEVPIEHSSRI